MDELQTCLQETELGRNYIPNQKVAYFVLYLKIINTFMKDNICIL